MSPSVPLSTWLKTSSSMFLMEQSSDLSESMSNLLSFVDGDRILRKSTNGLAFHLGNDERKFTFATEGEVHSEQSNGSPEFISPKRTEHSR